MKIETVKTRGITLIALIITIILMLILAGVVLSLSIGENGLFKTAKYTVQKNSEVEAKEKLELALADLQAHKYTDEAYNENEYIDDYLNNENIEILGNIATVGNWDFEIDRSIPSIKVSLGASTVKLTKEVKSYLGKNENDKYVVSILVKIESNKKLESIEFENLDGSILTVVPEKETITKDMQIELDREYKIVLKMAEGKTINRTIIERSVENIRTVEELVAFRDKVNTGLTYEGKTINLLADLDLSSVCGAEINGEQISWEPIGNYGTDNTHIFKGIFNGNKNTIDNLYINTTNAYQGLFGENEGTIESLAISGKIVNSGEGTGSFAGNNRGTIINCKNNAYIQVHNVVGGITGSNSGVIEKCCNTAEIYSTYGNTGGITGTDTGTIKLCYNTGYVHSNFSTGGISGYKAGGNTYNCYNIGIVNSGMDNCGGINGAAGSSWNSWVYTYNCYNLGNVTANRYVGQITGLPNANGGGSQDINCYSTNATVELLNAGAYSNNEWVDDVKIKDTETGEETWKYNNGYPILKWQLEN